MSDNSACVNAAPGISAMELSMWKIAFYQVASFFVLWGEFSILVLYTRRDWRSDAPNVGLQISLSCQAIYILWYECMRLFSCVAQAQSCTRNRGLSGSIYRQCMATIVLVMMGSSTAIVILNLNFFVVQLPAIGLHKPIEITRKMISFDIGQIWLTRLNVRKFKYSPPAWLFLNTIWLAVLSEWCRCRMESVGALARKSTYSMGTLCIRGSHVQ